MNIPKPQSPSIQLSRHSLSSLLSSNMFGSILSVAVVALAATATAAPAALEERATTCSFSGASGATAVASAKSSCPTITLDSLVVPAGKTLDLTKLAKV